MILYCQDDDVGDNNDNEHSHQIINNNINVVLTMKIWDNLVGHCFLNLVPI